MPKCIIFTLLHVEHSIMAGNKSKCNKKYNKNKESLKRKCIEEEAATAAAHETKKSIECLRSCCATK